MKRAFTLIELLIVVAIIAILAAIAVPNFLEAQVRSKVSRGVADMRSMATAIESYKIDTNSYPPDYQYYQYLSPPVLADVPLFVMTTPVAYMTSLPSNPFVIARGVYDGNPEHYGYKAEVNWRKAMLRLEMWAGFPPDYRMLGPDGNLDVDLTRLWVLDSCGPDLVPSQGTLAMFGDRVVARALPVTLGGEFWSDAGAIYDATNGTISNGDIVRVGP